MCSPFRPYSTTLLMLVSFQVLGVLGVLSANHSHLRILFACLAPGTKPHLEVRLCQGMFGFVILMSSFLLIFDSFQSLGSCWSSILAEFYFDFQQDKSDLGSKLFLGLASRHKVLLVWGFLGQHVTWDLLYSLISGGEYSPF